MCLEDKVLILISFQDLHQIFAKPEPELPVKSSNACDISVKKNNQKHSWIGAVLPFILTTHILKDDSKHVLFLLGNFPSANPLFNF